MELVFCNIFERIEWIEIREMEKSSKLISSDKLFTKWIQERDGSLIFGIIEVFEADKRIFSFDFDGVLSLKFWGFDINKWGPEVNFDGIWRWYFDSKWDYLLHFFHEKRIVSRCFERFWGGFWNNCQRLAAIVCIMSSLWVLLNFPSLFDF